MLADPVGDFRSSVIDEGGYGRFGAYRGSSWKGFFHLDDEDRRLIRTVPIDPPPALPQINSGVGRREGSSRQVVSDVTADKGSLSAVNP